MDIALDDDLDLEELGLDDKEASNDETITEGLDDTSLDLQIGDDDLELNLDMDIDQE